MKNRNIIIHVGLPKTASTYLQSIVFPRLNNVAYIGRPYTQENYAFNSLQYADKSLYAVSAIREEIDFIENKIAQGNPILISDELFSGYALYNFINRGIIAERLSKIIPEAEIILFLRGQVDLIMSLYNQFVKVGWFEHHLDESFLYRPGKGFSLEKWIEGDRGWNIKNNFINYRSSFSPEHFRYSKIYSLYSNLFRKVHIFLYEDFKKDQKACLLRIASILSTELPSDLKYDGKIKTNKGLGNNQLHEKLVLNRLNKLNGLGSSRVGKMFATFISSIISDNEDSNKAHVISLLKERDIFSDNRALNEKVNLGMEKYPKPYFGDSV